MKFQVVSKINTKKINDRLGGQLEKNMDKMKQTMLNDSNRYIRVDTGKMKASGFIDKDGIGWSEKYTPFAYYETNSKVNRTVNPNATSRWFEHARSIHGEEWNKISKEGLK